jgi:hypothetical protein
MKKSRKTFPILLVLTLVLALVAMAISAVQFDRVKDSEIRALQAEKAKADRVALTSAVQKLSPEEQSALMAKGEAASDSRMLISAAAPPELMRAAPEGKDEMAAKAAGDKPSRYPSVSAVAPDKAPYDGPPYVPYPDPGATGSGKQGGDIIEEATVISGIPYTNTGVTCGYNNDYDEVCPYTGSTAPDVVYEYSPDVDVLVTISLCNPGTDYDTKLYLYEDTYTPGDPYACNDDGCPDYESEIAELDLYSGHTYYIVVDGYGADCGNYEITIVEVEECVVECPPDASDEGEPCGDDTNGGCNSTPPVFTTIGCEETICGLAWADGGTRDTDWYELAHGLYRVE